MRINCIGCGHRFDLDNSYDDYRGLMRCPTCAELLHIHIEDGMVRSMMPSSMIQMEPVVPAVHQAAPAAPATPADPMASLAGGRPVLRRRRPSKPPSKRPRSQ
ncbi:MAG: hypothetical protein AAF995_01005 [Planctomycetota bacterium]